MKILSIIGTRPQYIKHGALVQSLIKEDNIELITIDTGQHYDDNMSNVFIRSLKLKDIKYNLKIKSSFHGDQTAKMLIEIEQILLTEKPEVVILYGDTNSTLAGALAASKLKIKILHVEAGMRNHNIQVPEEINRALTDRVSFIRFASSPDSLSNLINEGLKNNSYHVGDITTDLILNFSKKLPKYEGQSFIFATIHRPFNTDSKDRLLQILNSFNSISQKIVLSLHPRTRNAMLDWDIKKSSFSNISFIEPLSFFETLESINNAQSVITDSGGVQKECYILRKKCTTILPYTPWVETLKGDWNKLVFNDLNKISKCIDREVVDSLYQENLYGDGKVGKRILEIMKKCIKY